MSNMPTLPDADVAEPIPGEKYDDDAIGQPLPDDGNADLPTPDLPAEPGPDVVSPEPARPL